MAILKTLNNKRLPKEDAKRRKDDAKRIIIGQMDFNSIRNKFVLVESLVTALTCF